MTNSGNGGIINSGSGNVALENQRYGRNKSTLVNKSYIESGEYRRKFDKLTENPKINKSLFNAAREALKHRSGTLYEDMYWIDGDTGDVVAKVVDQKGGVTERVIYPYSVKKAIEGKRNLFTLHTHPQSMPPSPEDFNSAFYHGYKLSVIACHNGRVFAYAANEEININLFDLYTKAGIRKGLDEFNAQLYALNEIKRSYDIYFKEVD